MCWSLQPHGPPVNAGLVVAQDEDEACQLCSR